MTEIPSDQHITYQLQFRKCGKPTCSTCRNTQGHGPYWYAYWRVGSRLKSGYIGKNSNKPADGVTIRSRRGRKRATPTPGETTGTENVTKERAVAATSTFA